MGSGTLNSAGLICSFHYCNPLFETFEKRPFLPISVSGLNFNPQNTQCIPVVKIFIFLELEQK